MLSKLKEKSLDIVLHAAPELENENNQENDTHEEETRVSQDSRHEFRNQSRKSLKSIGKTLSNINPEIIQQSVGKSQRKSYAEKKFRIPFIGDIIFRLEKSRQREIHELPTSSRYQAVTSDADTAQNRGGTDRSLPRSGLISKTDQKSPRGRVPTIRAPVRSSNQRIDQTNPPPIFTTPPTWTKYLRNLSRGEYQQRYISNGDTTSRRDDRGVHPITNQSVGDTFSQQQGRPVDVQLDDIQITEAGFSHIEQRIQQQKCNDVIAVELQRVGRLRQQQIDEGTALRLKRKKYDRENKYLEQKWQHNEPAPQKAKQKRKDKERAAQEVDERLKRYERAAQDADMRRASNERKANEAEVKWHENEQKAMEAETRRKETEFALKEAILFEQRRTENGGVAKELHVKRQKAEAEKINDMRPDITFASPKRPTRANSDPIPSQPKIRQRTQPRAAPLTEDNLQIEAAVLYAPDVVSLLNRGAGDTTRTNIHGMVRRTEFKTIEEETRQHSVVQAPESTLLAAPVESVLNRSGGDSTRTILPAMVLEEEYSNIRQEQRRQERARKLQVATAYAAPVQTAFNRVAGDSTRTLIPGMVTPTEYNQIMLELRRVPDRGRR